MPRFWILSDLHFELSGPRRFAVPPCDAAIFAGDVDHAAVSIQACRAIAGPDLPIFCVAGNHEFYTPAIPMRDGLDFLREEAGFDRAAGHQTHFLHDETLTLDLAGERMRFIGSTLWTDFALFDNPVEHAGHAAKWMSDYRLITRDSSRGLVPIQPSLTASLHRKSRQFIEQTFLRPFDGKTVVITHHLPSIRSVPPRYITNAVSAAFASNADDLLDQGAALWIHGHSHASVDYRAGSTRVIANPCGYMRGARFENTDFDPGLVIEV